MIRVTSNTYPDALIPQLNHLTAKQFDLQQQLATGQRITNPSDDPAAMGRILSIQSEKRELSQYQRNISRLESIANFTFDAVESMQRLNQRATELGTRATEVLGEESFTAFALEVNEVLEQALDIGNSKYLKDHIFAGAAVDSDPFTATRDGNGRITATAYAGSTTSPEVSISEVSKVEAYVGASTNNEINTFLNNLVALRDALETFDSSNVQTALDSLYTDEDEMIVTLSEVSSKVLRLEVAQTQQQERFRQFDQRLSIEADADFAEGIVNLTTTQNAYQAALSSAGRVLNTSLLDFL